MEIKVCTTSEWSDDEWNSYRDSFNSAFNTDLNCDIFRNSYLNTIDGHAYHALLLNDDLIVVGCCTVIPILYKRNNVDIKIGQAVGVFILEEYRIDPLMLRKMYFRLKEILIENNIIAVMAVPNATSYSYWRNVVKWKDVGDLSYWILPIKIGNVIKKWTFLNVISSFFTVIWLMFSDLLTLLFNNKQKVSKYELDKSEIFYKYRYFKEYKFVSIGSLAFTYIVYDEQGVNTAYLLEINQNENFSFRDLLKAVRYISKLNNVDVILHIGTLKLFQTVLIKVPKRFEPKRLPLTCDILLKENIDFYSDMLKISNWNFGLLNYDVR